ncbi:GMC family oxidoreductase [Streptomyces jumonjinensis]|uniref:Choline dehydrogenase n=1 Tax=Streptomyces jumonjinensis TaxID=1945 RepID=A0A646KGY9_STRJU|nr:GMC family oxidoreductase N-terminal domain-containing protein [Streptomyces jumonjinensis]MQT01330.1 choline dehydrogenase [Streptomyces jumonjinensis]
MPKQSRTEHDYVIVGAGSAGSVIARRLIDQGFSVHILEAGPADDDPLVHSPQGWPALLRSPPDWALTTVPQRHADDRRLYWPRGRVLGGSSSLNGMIYIRGHRSDYDSWAYGGCPGWDWESVLPYFLRSEDHLDGPSAWHGQGGPLPVSRITDRHPAAEAFVAAALSLGHPPTDDFNGERMTGVGFNHVTVRDGRRMSAWRSFMAPVAGRPLVRVSTGARAHRVLLERGRAVGVEYALGGMTHRAYAASEVILSAGVVGSAQLLLLSGIGPAAHLRRTGVEVTVELPGVGENLHDHLLVSNVYEASRPLPPGRANVLESQLFAATDSRRPGPDLQPVFLHLVYPAESYPAPEHGYTIAPGLVRPLSRGTLRLASADPEAAVLLDPGVLAEPHDLESLVDAVELSREIGNSGHFADWYRAEAAPGPRARTRNDLRAYVRRAVGTYHHQVGTCRMGQDSLSVVDPELRVHGVPGLRVADASVMPSVPSGNTNAPTIMIGEKAADLVLHQA